MKRNKLISLALVAAMAVSIMSACGQEGDAVPPSGGGFDSQPIVSVDDNPGQTTTDPVGETGESFEVPADCYLSELTGLPVKKELKDQRPIAVMVDNEKTALPHYEIV